MTVEEFHAEGEANTLTEGNLRDCGCGIGQPISTMKNPTGGILSGRSKDRDARRYAGRADE